MEKHRINITHVRDNPYQTREDYGDLSGLSSSIKRFGLVQPLPARKADSGYELIFGSRRFRALKEAGLDKVDIDVKEVTNQEMALIALCENTHRKDLNPVELARAYSVGMKVSGLEMDEFAKVVGASITKVRSYLSILNLPDRVLKSDKYNAGELVGLARLHELSRTLSIEMEDVLEDRSLSAPFLQEVVEACARIYKTSLPEKKKIELCGKVLWEDYSKLGLRQEHQITEFGKHLISNALIEYEERLRKTEKARAALARESRVRHVSDIPNYDRRVDRAIALLKKTDTSVGRLYKEGVYKHASNKTKNRFDYWIKKLVGGLEKVLSENERLGS
ncbi:MAG: ParB/RepB/Spo0J family partition protein [archaeon]|jgi:ParB/RepB/Spo0J family partition protein|nr:ParB/RepB/Spo0J family partition protein [archaeon]